MQPKFRIEGFFGCLILLAAIIMFSDLLFFVPNRTELGWRIARIDFRPVDFDASRFGPLRLAGAWKLTSTDERFGGVSALAIDRGQLLALTNSGVLIRFNRPRDGQRPTRHQRGSANWGPVQATAGSSAIAIPRHCCEILAGVAGG